MSQKTTEELERELEKSENRRKRVEARSHPEANEALLAITEFKKLYDNVLEAKAFQRVTELLDMKATVENVADDLGAMRNKLVAVMENVDGLTNFFQSVLNDVNAKLAGLEQRLNAEETKNAELRELEKETLHKINDYLDKWT